MAVFAILLCLAGGAIGMTSDSCPSNFQECFLEEYKSISEQNRKEIEELITRKIEQVLGSRTPLAQTPTSAAARTYSGCDEVRLEAAKSQNETGGVFDISIPGLGTREVYCDTMTDGGKWIVFQRRMDGSVDFFRNWNDYVAGFGMPSGEHWLGLETIHQLTKLGNAELRIDLIERNGNYYYVKYSSFKIGPASDNYRLSLDGYSGNASDSFVNPPFSGRIINNQQFSTRDVDNDPWAANCASYFKSGWWFNACTDVNLNGMYSGLSGDGILWSIRKNRKWMKFTEMKLRYK